MHDSGSPTIWCQVVFLPPEEGGRSQPLSSLQGCQYRPHLVVGDPGQGLAIVTEDNVLLEHYLGVAFFDGEGFRWGEPLLAELVLMYEGVDYSALAQGATFTIREGGRIVGYGEAVG